MTIEAVCGTQAAIYRGELAIRAGLADRVGTLDLAIAEMAADASLTSEGASAGRVTFPPTTKRSPSMATNETEQIRPEARDPQAQPQPPLASQMTTTATAPGSECAASLTRGSMPAPAAVPEPESAVADRLRAEYAETAAVAAQPARLGVTVDAADAMRKGVSAEALRRLVLDELAARAEAASVVTAAPSSPAATDSPIVRRAKQRAAAARA